MMQVKIGRNTSEGVEEFSIHQCEHIEVKVVKPNSYAATAKPKPLALPGVYLELVRGRETTLVSLPADGHVAYVTNERGQTTDTFRWPLTTDQRATG